MILVYSHKESIVQTPPVPTLDRAKIAKGGANFSSVREMVQPQLDSISFTLKGSGRIIRKVEASPPIGIRTWKPLQNSELCDNVQTIEQALAGRQLIAETIYIMKPMTHLISMACFGRESWKPWVVALVMDVTR